MEFHKESVKTPKMKTTIMQTENAKPMISSKGTQCNLTRLDGQVLHQEISYLQNEIISISNQEISDQTIPKLRERTRGNPYTNKIRECVLYCISKNVPMQNISDVIGSIVKIVNGHEIDNLPSVASIHNMSREAKAICNRQVEEAIGNSENITLMKDATSKQGRHFYGTKISGSEGEFTLGIKEISSGSAEQYVKATLDIVHEITEENAFLTKLTNCMTDRSATELKSNKILNQLKNSKEENNEMTINEFQCSVHPLLQFADEVEKVAKDIEKTNSVRFNTLFRNKGESYTHNLIRCISKLFYNEKVGDPAYCRTFLKSNNIDNIPIQDFVGNRFNTLFYNACGTFCLKDLLSVYIKSSKNKPNFLQTSILQLFENDIVTSICQSIGIIYIKITAPYFSLASQNKPALQMKPVYNTLVEELEKIVKNQLYFWTMIIKYLQLITLKYLISAKAY
ncbi:Hypothetical predicted protein [Mytilus galloprovincialis]|uniref:Uncharacterized protein n=1 Tax=Mytilus galloprovincialis TaxID=29158 RepID=A0A8B6DF38_MYTGA|nr:Hypothetical predicted protein [Mytilus galloprovincialis]